MKTWTFIFFLFYSAAVIYAENVPVKAWEAYYEGPGCADDVAYKITKDPSGNIYVSGTSYAGNESIVTVKYDANGNQMWSTVYNGNSYIYFTDLQTDKWGNVFVAGTIYNNVTNDDFVLIKYDTNGIKLWEQVYNDFLTNADEYATDLFVDNLGNVFITGKAFVSDLERVVTIKFDGNGNFKWHNKIDGWIRNWPRLAVDSNCCAIVTYSDCNYVTVKYDANGTELWRADYDSPELFGSYSFDIPKAITIDNSGNVYVTGTIGTDATFMYQIATVKYSSDGRQVWVAGDDGFYDQSIPESIEVDSEGNVYVAGGIEGTDGTYDCITKKYNSLGEQLWASEYDDKPPYSGNYAYDLKVDNAGNVYVSGSSYSDTFTGNGSFVTIKYSPNGDSLWSAKYEGPYDSCDVAWSLVLDNSGNVIVTGGSVNPVSGYDFTTIKYDPQGQQRWVAFYKGKYPARDNNRANAIAVDDFENVYVTGSGFSSGKNKDYITVKYDVNGNEVWASRFGTINNDEAEDIAVDKSGNSYVTGYSGNENGNYLTLKYAQNGELVWSTNSKDVNDDCYFANTLALDELDNVYVSGHGRILKYNNDGNYILSSRFWSNAESLKIDAQKKLYTCGWSWSSDNSYHYVTQKCDPDGKLLWTSNYNGTKLNGDDKAYALDVDKFGNVYVVGYSENVDSPGSAMVKYDSNGSQQWVVFLERSNVYHLILDKDGNIYVTGSKDNRIHTIKYGSNGNVLWEKIYNGPGNHGEHPTAITLDKRSNVYVAGYSDGGSSENDYCIVKYDTNGNQLWVLRYNGRQINSVDYAYDFTLDNFGNIYITGASDYAFCTVKYKQDNYCVKAISSDFNSDCKIDFSDFSLLAQNWLATISFDDLAELADNWLSCNLAFDGDCWQ